MDCSEGRIGLVSKYNLLTVFKFIYYKNVKMYFDTFYTLKVIT